MHLSHCHNVGHCRRLKRCRKLILITFLNSAWNFTLYTTEHEYYFSPKTSNNAVKEQLHFQVSNLKLGFQAWNLVFRLATLISDLQIETWFSDLQLDFQACNFVFRLATWFSDLQLYFLAVNFILKLETWNLAVRTAHIY